MLSAHYRVELFDPKSNGFIPSRPGIGMHVEVRNPDDNIILSRVNMLKEYTLNKLYNSRNYKKIYLM